MDNVSEDNTYNLSFNDYYNVSTSDEDIETLEQFWGIFLSVSLIVSIIGIFGNSLVIHVIKNNSKLHTVTNILLFNLALTDNIILILNPIFIGFVTSGNWNNGFLGIYSCKLFYYILHVTLYVAIYTVVAIAVLRYVAIVHEERTRLLRTRRNVIVLTTFIWCLILCANIPIFNSYIIFEWSNHYYCIPFTDEVGYKISAIFFTFTYALPLSLICVISLSIHLQMQRTLGGNVDEDNNVPISLITSNNLETNNNGSLRMYSAQGNTRRRKASRLLLVVVCFFAIMWLPVQIDQLLTLHSLVPFTISYEITRVFFFILAFCNSAVNPIIYNVTSEKFRSCFKQTLCCCHAKLQQELLYGRRKSSTLDTKGTAITNVKLSPLLEKKSIDCREITKQFHVQTQFDN